MQSIAAIICAALAAASATTAGSSDWVATSTGIGPLKIGMTVAQASQAAGETIVLSDPYSDDPKVCAELEVPHHPGLFVLFENERISSMAIAAHSSILTARGIGIGAFEKSIKAVYMPLEIEAADFDEAPAANLTWWARKDIAGIRFKTGTDRKVQYIAIGGPSLKYTEGCL